MIQHIRNFAIIAHIDHGKSTLADRMLEHCYAVEKRLMQDQLLDSMDLERERGITIKAHAVRLTYQAEDGQTYIFNVIDTPGHADFAYEVSRSLAACESSLLVVDACQGVQAQTLENVYHALEVDHTILAALNKIDAPLADPAGVTEQVVKIVGVGRNDILSISARTGEGVKPLLERIVRDFPQPTGDSEAPLQALLIDSIYNEYLGVVIMIRIKNGSIRKGMRFRMLSSGDVHQVEKIGVFTPKMKEIEALQAGEVGFITASIKDITRTSVGDTLVQVNDQTTPALPGFKPTQPTVFCGMFPNGETRLEDLRTGLGKLRLNDSSFTYQPTSSEALGHGFTCGFLGLLHMEIVEQRLARELGIDVTLTAPNVSCHLYLKNGKDFAFSNPASMPDPTTILRIEEPWAAVNIIVPTKFLGSIITLCEDNRGKQQDITFLEDRALVKYHLPLKEIIHNFYDQMKSLTQGYASLSYEIIDYRPGDLIRVDFLLNSKPVDALTQLMHRDRSRKQAQSVCGKLKEIIPRRQFKISIQAAIGSKIICRETISSYRKDVTAKIYGGDVSRKMKLLDKQKRGKKLMRNIGTVEVPKNALVSVLKIKD